MEPTPRSSRATFKDYAENAIPFLGKLRISEIRPRHLDELAATIASRGSSPATVRLALAPVKALLATAYQRGDIRTNPAAGWRCAFTRATDEEAEAEEQVKRLSADELARLLAEISPTSGSCSIASSSGLTRSGIRARLSCLRKERWNAKQVQVWPGHHSPEFTLKTYVDLLEEDMPVLSHTFGEWGNAGATKQAETDRNATLSQQQETAQALGLIRAV